jgi:hypothetical protein
VTVLEGKEKLVKKRFALALGLFEPRQDYESHLEHIVANLRMPVVPQRQVLDCLCAGFAEVKVKLQKADGVELGNVEVVFISFLRKAAYSHTEIVKSPAYEMLLLFYLDFHNESCTCGIFAIDVKHCIPVELSLSEQFTAYYAHLFDGCLQLFCEKGVEEEQKEFRSLLVSKGFFESGIQSKRSILGIFYATGTIASLLEFYRHTPPYKKDSYNKITPPTRVNIEKSEPDAHSFRQYANNFTFTPQQEVSQ